MRALSWSIWFITAGMICIVVAAGFVLLLPVQLLMFVVLRKPWSETSPYEYLHFMLYRGWAEPGTTTRPYQEWRLDKYMPDDLWVDPDIEERKQRESASEESK